MSLPGPAGPFYKKGGNVSQFNEGETGLSIVQCDIGDIAISGSADYIVSQGGSIFEINDFQSDFSNSTWVAAMRIQNTPANATGLVQTFAICLDNPPL